MGTLIMNGRRAFGQRRGRMNSRRLNDTLRETGLKEGHDHFFAHFISFYPNGWAYHSM